MVLEPGHDFLLVADADGPSDGRAERVAAVEGQVDGVAEADPFFVGEQVAEAAVAVGDCFVGAHGLCRVRVANGPFVSFYEGGEALGGVGEVVDDPFGCCVLASSGLVGIGAVERAGEGVVKVALFDDDFDGGIVGPVYRLASKGLSHQLFSPNYSPFQSKKASHEILGRLEHTILCLPITSY